jgi:hypothetical protein
VAAEIVMRLPSRAADRSRLRGTAALLSPDDALAADAPILHRPPMNTRTSARAAQRHRQGELIGAVGSDDERGLAGAYRSSGHLPHTAPASATSAARVSGLDRR